MSHPYNEHRADKHAKERVGHIAGHFASGGAVPARASGGKMAGVGAFTRASGGHVDGKKAKHRADRVSRKKRADGGGVKAVPITPGGSGWLEGRITPEKARQAADAMAKSMGPPKKAGGRIQRAKGGRVGKGKTIVNVNVAPQSEAKPPMIMPPPGPPPGGPPPMPPHPPMGGPPPGLAGPGGPPGMPPPGMHSAGGRAYAKGGAVKSVGMHVGTKVSHDPGKNDTADIGRRRVVTFMAGGRVKARKTGGRIESPEGIAPATKLPGGAGGGEGRLAKARKY